MKRTRRRTKPQRRTPRAKKAPGPTRRAKKTPARPRRARTKTARASRRPTVPAKAAAPAPSDREAVEALRKEVRRLRRARARLERRLTSAVQEIGILRQLEFRAQRLEDDLGKRDEEIARMRLERANQLSQLELRLGGASFLSTPS